MHPGRRLRADRTGASITAHGRGDDDFGARLDLLDLDTGQVRKELLDGITQPDNDSSTDAHHTICARAEFGRQMSLNFGTTEISPIPMFASSGPTPSETRSGVVGRPCRSRSVTGD